MNFAGIEACRGEFLTGLHAESEDAGKTPESGKIPSVFLLSCQADKNRFVVYRLNKRPEYIPGPDL